jgi:hypothetical protein
MSKVHSFENFLAEAKVQRTATIKAEADTEITHKIEKLLREAMKLTEEVEAQKAEFEKALKIKELELKSKNAAIMDVMKGMDTTTLKFKKILATINTTKGKITFPYAKLWEFALDQATATQKKALLNYKEINKKLNPDRLSLELKRVQESEINEGVMDMLSGIWNWLKSKVEDFMNDLRNYNDSVNALESLVESKHAIGEDDGL